MFTEQAALLAELKPLFAKGGLDGDRIANVLAKYTANCVANLVHRGSLTLEQIAESGRRDATLTVKRFPAQPETYATEDPSNGYAADFWGKVRIRGHAQFDQGIGIANFAQLLALFPVGFQMPWHDEADIPTGWAIMDGVSNAAGSGIDRGGRVGYGYISGDPTFGTLGAAVSVALTWSGSPIATSGAAGISATTDGAGSHDHTVAHTGVRDAITIDAHSASSGGSNISTAKDIWTVDDAPALAVFDGTTAPDSNYLSGDGDEVTAEGHDHNIAKADVASALANHTITAVASPSSITTSSQSNHQHTLTIPDGTITAGLVVNTPSTIRPPGVVELWIEKLS